MESVSEFEIPKLSNGFGLSGWLWSLISAERERIWWVSSLYSVKNITPFFSGFTPFYFDSFTPPPLGIIHLISP